MPKFIVIYNVTYVNGEVIVTADSKEHAEKKFGKMRMTTLRRKSKDTIVELASVQEVEK